MFAGIIWYTVSISWSTIYAIFFMKSPNVAISNTFLSKLMPWATIKNDKIISGVKYINSFCIESCILKHVWNWPLSLEHTQKYQYLMNGSRYDQIRSSGVWKTYITISEGIPYCTDWKMAFVWLLYQPSTHKFQIYCGIIPVIIPMKFLKMPQNNKFLSKLILWGILKNVKSISGVNYIDSLHMKWCTLKNMGNWPFSPGHTMSHKNNNILGKAPDFTKIKN